MPRLSILKRCAICPPKGISKGANLPEPKGISLHRTCMILSPAGGAREYRLAPIAHETAHGATPHMFESARHSTPDGSGEGPYSRAEEIYVMAQHTYHSKS